MLTPRRTAQLGILSATAVLIISLGVLIMQGGGVSGQRSSHSASVTSPPAQSPSIPLELSVASQPHTTQGGQQ
jgi:hypothetical protein